MAIKPVIITGDHPLTACAIAKQIGIYDDQKKVVTGQELDRLSDEELKSIIDDVAIFARVTPEHKLRIVTVLQEKGHIVAMTGDGVNDSPAIKKGRCRNCYGTNRNPGNKRNSRYGFKGRSFWIDCRRGKRRQNDHRKYSKSDWLFVKWKSCRDPCLFRGCNGRNATANRTSSNLLMNMLTDALPAMVLAINPGKKTKETKRQEIIDGTLYKQVITRGAILGVGSLGLFMWALGMGIPLATAQTVAFATLVAGQLVQTFSWRQAGSGES